MFDAAHDDAIIPPGEQIGDDVFDDAAGDGVFSLVEKDGFLRARGDVFQPAQRMQEHVAHALDGDGLALKQAREFGVSPGAEDGLLVERTAQRGGSHDDDDLARPGGDGGFVVARRLERDGARAVCLEDEVHGAAFGGLADDFKQICRGTVQAVVLRYGAGEQGDFLLQPKRWIDVFFGLKHTMHVGDVGLVGAEVGRGGDPGRALNLPRQCSHGGGFAPCPDDGGAEREFGIKRL